MAGSRPLFLVQIPADPDPEMREREGVRTLIGK